MGRALAGRRPPAARRSPRSDDAGLTSALQDLREARAELRDATLEGDPAPALSQRVTRLEAVVRGRTMRAGPGAGGRGRHPRPGRSA